MQDQASLTQQNELTFDLGNLLVFDPKPLDLKLFKEDPSKSLCENARETIQLMFSQLLQLPVSRPPEGMNGVVIDLPTPNAVIPREKPIPKSAPKTKWEKFAEAKGIIKRKRGRMVMDENTGELRPRFGYKRSNDMSDDWVVEAKPNDDPTVDPFTKKVKEKKERVEKQTVREKKNRIRAAQESSAIYLPPTIAVSNDLKTKLKDKKSSLEESLKIAQRATISMGKFDRTVEGEKRMKQKKNFENLHTNEKTKNIKVLDRVLKKSGNSFDVQKAVNQTISDQQKKRRSSQEESRPKKKRK